MWVSITLQKSVVYAFYLNYIQGWYKPPTTINKCFFWILKIWVLGPLQSIVFLMLLYSVETYKHLFLVSFITLKWPLHSGI